MGLFRQNPTQRNAEVGYMKGGRKHFKSYYNFPFGDLHRDKKDSQNAREGGDKGVGVPYT
jgi:hypothetical protein